MRHILILIGFFITAPFVKADVSLLKQGVKYYQQGKYVNAAIAFHQLTNAGKITEDVRVKSNYYLGLSLFNLKLYQASSYPMIKVIKSNSNKFKQKSLEKLIVISNKLGDQHMLDYAMSKMQVSDLEKLAVDVFYFKLAAVSYDKRAIEEAIDHLKKALASNPNSEPALNLLALSYLKKNDVTNGIDTYHKLLALYAQKTNNNPKRSYTLLNLARAYFQAKKFEDAAEFYRNIPKDSQAYRESLTELGWSYLHMGKVRAALSVIHTLHTPFYENYFEPESLVLRAILLNYNCHFEDAEAAVQSYNDNYANTLDILNNWTSQSITVADAIAEINYATESLKSDRSGSQLDIVNDYKGRIPFKITRSILKDFRLKNIYDAFLMIREESKASKKYFNGTKSNLEPFLDKIYAGRLNFMKKQLAVKFNDVILFLDKNITYYSQQMKFVSYEILDAKKSQLRIKISAENEQGQANEVYNRNFYIKNGFRYWPFQGEFWLDEIGNYQYLGDKRCVEE